MPPAARVTDMHTCPLLAGANAPISSGAPAVLIGGLPAARVTDTCTCAGPPDIIVKGSTTVLIAGVPAARIGDATSNGGSIVAGLPTVIIGG
jgi:uncharacterized Zn-binding protein involved in type VI secretion